MRVIFFFGFEVAFYCINIVLFDLHVSSLTMCLYIYIYIYILEVQIGRSSIPNYGECNTSKHDLFGGDLFLQHHRRGFEDFSNCIMNLETRFDGIKQDGKLSICIVYI